MIDRYGLWHAEIDYSGVPKGEMCVCDHIAQWIGTLGYEVLTTIDNLVLNIIACYEAELRITCKSYYEIAEDVVADIKVFVGDDIIEYDYWTN